MSRKLLVLAIIVLGVSLVLTGSLRTGGTAAVVVTDPVPVRVLPDPEPEAAPVVAPAPERVVYEGPVEHIFFHPLIVYPELAFDGDGLSQGYDDWFATAGEFRRVVESLYQRGYILVSFDALFAQAADGGLERRPLRLPPGKKPLILSVDDLNYYQYMRENGNAYRLIIDTDGKVKTFSRTPQGEPVISDENEIVPLLDAFVAAHPDFALDGAKGVLALTGYEGILGYRTDDRNGPAFEAEKAEALKVVARLKETGWSFASHGWGHLDARKVSAATLERDTRRWKEEVESLIGPTLVYIYPFGSAPAPGDSKIQALRAMGFQIFCGVGPTPFLELRDGVARMDRRHIDGMAFRTQRKLLAPLFDADQIIDPIRPAMNTSKFKQ